MASNRKKKSRSKARGKKRSNSRRSKRRHKNPATRNVEGGWFFSDDSLLWGGGDGLYNWLKAPNSDLLTGGVFGMTNAFSIGISTVLVVALGGAVIAALSYQTNKLASLKKMIPDPPTTQGHSMFGLQGQPFTQAEIEAIRFGEQRDRLPYEPNYMNIVPAQGMGVGYQNPSPIGRSANPFGQPF